MSHWRDPWRPRALLRRFAFYLIVGIVGIVGGSALSFLYEFFLLRSDG